MNFFLKKHGLSQNQHQIEATIKRQGRKVELSFVVTKKAPSSWHSEASFTSDWRKNEGLWNFDVVEAFLQLRKFPQDRDAPYLEVQVSPLNQPFALIITDPRKVFFPPQNLVFRSDSSVDQNSWEANLQLELPVELQGALLFGGLFSCLGHNAREYYALKPNPEDLPDFHRPELFVALEQA